MNAQEMFYDALKLVASGGCYPVLAPESAVAPFIVLQRVGAPRENVLNKSTRASNVQVTVRCYGKTHEEAVTLKLAVIAAIDAYAGLNAVLEDDLELYEEPTQLFSYDLTYSCWETG